MAYSGPQGSRWQNEQDKPVMILGFTGTRQKTTSKQNQWLLQYMLDNPTEEFHHGCCVGADEQAHRTAKSCLDFNLQRIVLHPPSIDTYEMKYTDWDYANCVWYPRKYYLVRNADIVREADKLIALPDNFREKQHSGTWSTIRKAREAKKPVIICYPDGSLGER